ncbi:NAD(P)-binding domain-containing protein [Rhodopirellula sp. SWK7]|uniref:NAD(P)-binding domain-containing protein n=1 Tax=Rhodopirellula sp. SWK7 TaxID=595460 RepID=UPI0002BD8C8E|nr:NAD(P)-binding domain-containing protein [Rhodopirellula sp. SWK7]EMI40457.1 FAD-dependent oxidoreductase domain-containing protein 2 [Rhodopirellula sp. SWK7]
MITPCKEREIDFLIIGAGPAGVQLGYFMKRAGYDHLILEAHDRPGTFLEKYPRHGKLLSINKIHTGYSDRESQLRYDWNSLLCDDDEMAFGKYSKEYFPSTEDYARYTRDFVERFDLDIQFNTRVESVEKKDNGAEGYVVRDNHGTVYHVRCLVVAVGVQKPYIPEIPGIELTENYADMSIDPDDFAGQRVLILGKGNSAFETANHLISATRVTHLCSPSPIKMAWQTHFFGHLRAVNNDFLDTYILKGQNSVLDATVDSIKKVDGEYHVEITFTHAEGQRASLAYDRVLCCTGFRWDPTFFSDNCRPDMACEDRLPAMTSGWESTNLPGVFYAGTITQIRDLKKTMSSVLHGFRFNTAALFNLLAERYMDVPWPADSFESTPENIADKITAQVSSAAGLMHQPGFLGDCLVVDDETGTANYHANLAVDYIQDSHFADNPHYYIITMEYGEFEGDIFNKHRIPDAAKGYDDAYLHPRIRRMCRGQLISEHHISESLENDWRVNEHPGERPLIRAIDFIGQTDATRYQQTHRDQLLCFLSDQLAVGSPSESEMPAIVCSSSSSNASASLPSAIHSTGNSCPISRNG